MWPAGGSTDKRYNWLQLLSCSERRIYVKAAVQISPHKSIKRPALVPGIYITTLHFQKHKCRVLQHFLISSTDFTGGGATRGHQRWLHFPSLSYMKKSFYIFDKLSSSKNDMLWTPSFETRSTDFTSICSSQRSSSSASLFFLLEDKDRGFETHMQGT